MSDLDIGLELDSATQIPVTAVATPVDMMMPELPEVEAVPTVPPTPMGAETDVIYGPGGAPTPSDVMSLEHFGQAPVEALWTGSFGDNIDGTKYPVDLMTGQPIPEQVPLPVDGTIAGAIQATPMDITQKVGTKTTQTVQPTAGTNAALQGARNAVVAQDQALQEQAGIVAQLATDKEGIDQARYLAATEYGQRAEQLYQTAQAQAEESRMEIKRLRDEYASMPWQSYWGSKGAGDKMMLGLAVGLGALGQSQIGGQNLALSFIQANIDDHNKSQTMKFRNLEAQLSAAQNYSVQAQSAIKEQFNNLSALKAAGYDQLDKQLTAISSKTNTQAAKNKVDVLAAEIRLKGQKELFSMEQELNGRTTSTMDAFKTVGVNNDPTRFVTFDGKPMNEGQSKDYKFLLQGAPAIKTMEDLEATGITNTDQYAKTRKALMNEGRAGLAQGVVDAASAASQVDNYLSRLAAGNVGLQNYFRSARIATGQKLRLESGASISPSEYLGEVLKYLPGDVTQNISPATQKADLDLVRQSRRNFLVGARGAAQSGNKLWFEANQP